MRFKNLATMAAVAFALAVGTNANAAFDPTFSFSAAADPAFFTGGNGTTITSGSGVLRSGPVVSGPASGFLNASNGGVDINFANPTVTDSSSTPEAVSFRYGYDVTITQGGSGSTVTLLVTGTIGGTASAGGSSLTSFGFAVAPTSKTFADGTTFNFSQSPQGAGTAPNVGSGPGALVLRVSSTPAVPEPASIALMGLGGLGALGMLRRRRAAKA